MADTFGQFVLERLKRKGVSVREFARLAGYPSSHSYVSRVLRGVNTPPLKEMDAWAAPLGLDERERRRFDLLASVAHSPPLVREWFSEVDAGQAKSGKR